MHRATSKFFYLYSHSHAHARSEIIKKCAGYKNIACAGAVLVYEGYW